MRECCQNCKHGACHLCLSPGTCHPCTRLLNGRANPAVFMSIHLGLGRDGVEKERPLSLVAKRRESPERDGIPLAWGKHAIAAQPQVQKSTSKRAIGRSTTKRHQHSPAMSVIWAGLHCSNTTIGLIELRLGVSALGSPRLSGISQKAH